MMDKSKLYILMAACAVIWAMGALMTILEYLTQDYLGVATGIGIMFAMAMCYTIYKRFYEL